MLAPLATELPEKANSILCVRDGKDTLAVGNVTGAMAFQATIPVALVPTIAWAGLFAGFVAFLAVA